MWGWAGGGAGSRDESVPEPAGSENCPAAAHSRDRAGAGPLWIPEDPRATEPGGLAGGQEAGISAVSRRRLGAAIPGAAQAACVGKPTRAHPADGTESGVEHGLRGGGG